MSPQPVEPLGRANFLDIKILEERREVTMPFTDIIASKSTDSLSSPRVDVSEQLAFDLVIDGSAEEGRIEIPLLEGA